MSAKELSAAERKLYKSLGLYCGPDLQHVDAPDDHFTGLYADPPPKKSKSKPAAKSSGKPKSTGKKK